MPKLSTPPKGPTHFDMVVIGSLVLALHDDDTLNLIDVHGPLVDQWTLSLDCSRVLNDTKL